MTRREMLLLLALGCAAPKRLGRGDDDLVVWVPDRLGDADVTALAAAWRARHPGETSRDALTALLLADRAGGEPLGAHFARKVAAEHAAGRAELVDGWYLAPTEARLAAYADALTATSSRRT